jgi:hypothetical protein
MTIDSRAAWAANMQALHREAGGALQLWPILLTDVPPMMAEARRGNADALRLLLIVNDVLVHMANAALGQGPICAACSGELHASDFAFVVATPAGHPLAERALAMVICGRCGTDRKTVRAAGVRAPKAPGPMRARLTSRSQTEAGHDGLRAL